MSVWGSRCGIAFGGILGVKLGEHLRQLVWAVLIDRPSALVVLAHVSEDCRSAQNTGGALNKDALRLVRKPGCVDDNAVYPPVSYTHLRAHETS